MIIRAMIWELAGVGFLEDLEVIEEFLGDGRLESLHVWIVVVIVIALSWRRVNESCDLGWRVITKMDVCLTVRQNDFDLRRAMLTELILTVSEGLAEAVGVVIKGVPVALALGRLLDLTGLDWCVLVGCGGVPEALVLDRLPELWDLMIPSELISSSLRGLMHCARQYWEPKMIDWRVQSTIGLCWDSHGRPRMTG